MAIIRVKNLLIRTFIGFNPEELKDKQDVIINYEIEVDIPENALQNDDPYGIYDYKKITKKVIKAIQEGNFKLLEVLTKKILDLIMEDERVKWARVEVDKPHALRFAQSVSFEMEAKKMNTCIIEMGSNIDTEANIEKALSILKSEMHVVSMSNFIKTVPVGMTNQSDFLNGAVKITTELNKEHLNKYLKNIEDRLKRNRRQHKYGPRTIDLDIIVWNGTVVDDDYHTRDFVKSTVDELL